MVDMYRARLAWTSGGASWGDVKHYEGDKGLEHLKLDVLNCYLTEQIRTRDGWFGINLKSAWHKFLFGAESKHVKKIYEVEKLVGDEWQPLDVEIIEPGVIINAPS